ncbi:MAG TPA: phosphate signaling complex protein PhoU [Planctomycetota bacterium]|nr:phosphate signaling complex protein PhoU [Planctomycetota bacterium]
MTYPKVEGLITELKARLVAMGTAAESMIDRSVKCLLERDPGRHPEIFRTEEEVNRMHVEIDERVVNILALQHPVAADLRMVVMGAKMAGELERIGDQAVNICQNTAELLRYPPLKPLVDIPLMAGVARRMLRESLDSFVTQNVTLATKVLDTDDEVDAFKNQIFRELLTYMMADPGTISRALSLILISRNLERVADHATNIAEEVIYVAQGRDVRHRHETQKRTKEGE